LYSYTYVQGSGFRPCILIHMFRVQGSDLVFLHICSGFRVQTLYSYTYVKGSGFRPCILIHMFRVQGSDLVFLNMFKVQVSGFIAYILIHMFRVWIQTFYSCICSGFRVQALYSCSYVQGSGFRPCTREQMFRVQGLYLVFVLHMFRGWIQSLYSCVYVQESGFRVQTLHSSIYALGLGFRPCTYVQGSGFRRTLYVCEYVRGSDLLFLYICLYKVFRYCKLSSVQFFVSFI